MEKAITIERYNPASEAAIKMWNDFVSASRNGTFLFNRGFMDYHANRFADHSLIAKRGGLPVAILPANEELTPSGDIVLHSHGGLTYGGWLLAPNGVDVRDLVRIFDALREYADAAGIVELDYKPVPDIYCKRPSDDDQYALFRAGATLTECNISCAIRLADDPGFNKQQRRNLKRGVASGAKLIELADIADFHALLSDCLMERHGVKPVHTLAELELLRSRFPENIRFFAATRAGRLHAGVCVFDTGRVAHAQYICSDETGRSEGMLTLLFHWLINDVYASKVYFDFGISNEEHGCVLNEGLYRQKSSLGGSGVAYERYSLKFRE